MRISQRVEFVIASRNVTAVEITRRVGLEPDRTVVAGSKPSESTKVPPEHAWVLISAIENTPVDQQIQHVVNRLEPMRSEIKALTSRSGVYAVMQIVRFFEDTNGEQEVLSGPGGVEKIPGQHQLLGWHLSSGLINFFSDVGVEIDVDEYG